MDDLLAVALQEVAAEGAQGCSLSALWGFLQNHCPETGLPLDGSVKQALWKMLLSAGCVSFKGSDGEPLEPSSRILQDHQLAENLNVHLVASEEFRDNFLGIYDINQGDAKLSAIQRCILERLGRARASGVTQYEIGKEFGISGNRLFYIIKNLEIRGLVVRQSSIYRGERPIATNLIHLKRYVKGLKLGSHQRFEIQKGLDSGLDYDAKTNQESSTLVNDDLPALKAICDKLEEADDKVLVISDLKIALGYRFARGHRAWRRILSRLQTAGLVEVFEAKVEHKVLPCIRLVKPFELKAFATKPNVDETGLDWKGTKRGQVTEQVAELSLNRQIYDSIEQGGPAGVTVTEIFSTLGLSNRKNYFRLTDMIPTHGLRLQVENHKRSTQYRIWAPENLSKSQADVIVEENKNNEGPILQYQDPTITENQMPMPLDKVVGPSNSTEKITSVSNSSGEVVAPNDNVENADERVPIAGLDLVPFTVDEKTEEGDQSLMPSNNIDMPPQGYQITGYPITVSKCTQRTVALSSAHIQREKWIMERLERDKFILRGELHKWLEELEERKDILLDRKTVTRNLHKLQTAGRCKCMAVSLPGVSNYGQARTVDVVLLPSVEVNPELMTEIYERQRAFDTLVRTQGSHRWKYMKGSDDVPTLTGLKRMPKTEIVDKGGTLQDNGFISAKLVRCRMLHRFLWLYVFGMVDNSRNVEDCNQTNESVTATNGVFSLLVAVQQMPLELFLQVIGSTKHIKGLAERCRRGNRLSDIPTRESEALLDTNASGRLAWLVDILRRLKLLRIVMVPTAAGDDSDKRPLPSSVADNSDKRPQAGVAYALEMKPYIDEPALEPPSTISAHVLNLGPTPRHYFELTSKESLEEYWKSLEYFFRGSQSLIARRIFPGSTVPELFGARSWSSLRVMSMDQRTKLHKRMGLEDNKRVAYEECVKIARELNLSLDQVLGVSYEKNQRIRLQEMASKENPFNPSQINIALGPKKRTSRTDGIQESATLEITKRQRPHNHNGVAANPEKLTRGEDSAKKRKSEKFADVEDANDDAEPVIAPHIVVRKFRPLRKKKHVWKDGADRVLIACYTRQRAILGSRYNRVDWNTMPGLPAPPETCRRRISLLKVIPAVRKGMMALCNVLAARYTKYLRSQSDIDSSTGNLEFEGSDEISRDGYWMSSRPYAWDDFEDPTLSGAINDIIRCKNASRSSSLKRATESSSRTFRSTRQNICGVVDPIRTEAGDTSLTTQTENDGLQDCGLQNLEESSPGKYSNVSARTRPNRLHIRKKLQRPVTLKDVSSADLVQKSVGAATAVELIKLVFLNSAVQSEVSETLVNALRQCKESDIFTAFRFLKDHAMVAVGDDCHAFVLSPKFYQNCSLSPFMPSIADECIRFEAWLREMKVELEQNWLTLKAEQEWGELFHLFGTILNGQISIAPFLPAKGIGEKEQEDVGRKRKRDAALTEETPLTKLKTAPTVEEGGFGQRRERGFPGIEVKAHAATIAYESMLGLSSSKASLIEHSLIDEMPSLDTSMNQNASADMAMVASVEEGRAISLASNISNVGSSGLGTIVEDSTTNGESTVLATTIENSNTNGEDRTVLGTIFEDSTAHGENIVSIENIRGLLETGGFDKILLEQVHAAISSAGEDGIRLGETVQVSTSEGTITIEVGESYATALHTLGLAREVMAFDHIRIVASPYYERFFLHLPRADSDGVEEMVPVLPWLEADGKENAAMLASLNRRIMGIVVLNPGILEESIVKQVDVLNPMSCQKLLQLMVLDGHLSVRTVMGYDSTQPPGILQCLISETSKQRKLVCHRHYYADPLKTLLL